MGLSGVAEQEYTGRYGKSRLKQQTTKNPHYMALIVVVIGIYFCICVKYFHVGLMQVYAKIQGGQPVQFSHVEDEDEFGQIPRGFPTPTPKRFLSGVFQKYFEDAARRYFPLSEATLIPLHRRLVMKFSNLSLVMRSESRTVPRYLWGEYTLAQDGEGANRICGRPTFYKPADIHKLISRASYYNDLQRAWPDVHFYVFPILRVADWYAVEGLYGVGANRNLARDRYVREFRPLLDPAIGYAWGAEGLSFKDAVSCYYRTDHHLNLPGAYQVYRQIWQLFRQRNQQISSCWEPKGWIEIPNIQYYGSSALRAGHFDDFYDVIIDGIFELPELKILIHGFEGIERNKKNQYKTGHYRKWKFTSHSAAYFGSDYGLIEYTSAHSGYGNLLVISDSFDNCIEPLLASHFSHTYFVDLRVYAQDLGQEFNMDDFLTRHKITDVLFLGSNSWLLGLRLLTFTSVL